MNRFEAKDHKEFWQNATGRNAPERYLTHGKRTAVLLEFLPILRPGSSVLEVGCNAARNLGALAGAAHLELHGVDINQSAIAVAESFVPTAKFICADVSLEETWEGRPIYDLIYTMAVLQHIPEDSTLDYITKHALQIVTMENETTTNKQEKLHWPRNYKTEFEARGFKQVHCDVGTVAVFGAQMVFRHFCLEEKI